MKIKRSEAPQQGIKKSGPGILNAWGHFWFTAKSPVGLHSIRVLAGLLFLVWLLGFVGYQSAFFSLEGWFDLQAYREAGRLQGGPPAPFGWSILYLCQGDNAWLLTPIYWGSVLVLLLFTLGIATRITSVLTWVIVISFLANPAISYGADYLLGILAFYLMLGYVFLGQWNRDLWPLARVVGTTDTCVFRRWLPRSSAASPELPSYSANLAIRLIQVHFAIVVITTGLHKLQISDWWSGVAFWYPMHSPFETTAGKLRTPFHWAEFYLILYSLPQYLVLAWQIAFPLFAWRTGGWRFILVGGGFLGWLGVAMIFQLPIFGPLFFIGSLSYLTVSEWKVIQGWINRVLFRLEESPDPQEESENVGEKKFELKGPKIRSKKSEKILKK